MERQAFNNMGFWERQVACSKLWEELATPVYNLKDNKGRTPPEGKVRKTEWPGYWLYLDDEGYQLLEEQDMEGWVLFQRP